MYKPRVYKRQFIVVFSLTTSSFKVSLFSSANSWLANKLSCDSSCEFMLKTEKNNGLVDRVQVDGLSGHSHSGSVPLWQNAVARSGEEAEETCAVDSWQLSGVNEPRPDVEVVLPEWIRWRSSWSSAPCFLTRSSSLQQLMRDKEFQRSVFTLHSFFTPGVGSWYFICFIIWLVCVVQECTMTDQNFF